MVLVGPMSGTRCYRVERMRKLLGVAIAMALAGCTAEAHREQQDNSAGLATGIATSASAGPSPQVSRSDFEKRGLDWPLTVAEAKLGCTKLSRWVKVEGVKYALNGVSGEQGYADLTPIWRDDEVMAEALRARGAVDEPPTKVNIGDMIEEAGRFCSS